MGASSSKSFSSTDIVNESLTSVIMESSMNCDVKQHALQDMTFSDLEFENCNVNFSNISQEANLSINLSCSQDTANESDLQNKFASKLDNDLSSSVKGLNIGLSNAETSAITNIKNKIKTEINVKNVANCVASAIAEQKMKFNKIKAKCSPGQKFSFDNIRQTIVINTVASCVQKNANVTKALTELDTVVKNKLTSSVAGLDPMASSGLLFVLIIPVIIVLSMVMGGVSSKNGMIMIVVFLVIAAIIGFIIYSRKDKK